MEPGNQGTVLKTKNHEPTPGHLKQAVSFLCGSAEMNAEMSRPVTGRPSSARTCTLGCRAEILQGVKRHWTPGNLAKYQALYKHELDTWKFS